MKTGGVHKYVFKVKEVGKLLIDFGLTCHVQATVEFVW